MKKKIMLVFGTRPEAIKMAPVYHALKRSPVEFDTHVCVTAQHRQMLDQVLQVFGIVPEMDLDLMTQGQDLFDVTSAVLSGMRDVFRDHTPDAVLVHGDTTTSFATALACFYAGVPVGHVEAGLRTHDVRAPFPEEFNRQVVSKVARWHFAPTESSRRNLLAERVAPDSIAVTGNTVVDALFWVLDRIDSDPGRRRQIEAVVAPQFPFDLASRRYVLITGHRRENFGDRFMQICSALRDLAERFDQVHFIYPVHLNPNVQTPVKNVLSGLRNVHLVEPLGYEAFVYLLKNCHLVLTDSGGIQEEAPSLGKPVLVMRDATERPEAVEAGTVRLVGADRAKIVASVTELLTVEASYESMARAHNPYGDGHACERIVSVLRNI